MSIESTCQIEAAELPKRIIDDDSSSADLKRQKLDESFDTVDSEVALERGALDASEPSIAENAETPSQADPQEEVAPQEPSSSDPQQEDLTAPNEVTSESSKPEGVDSVPIDPPAVDPNQTLSTDLQLSESSESIECPQPAQDAVESQVLPIDAQETTISSDRHGELIDA